MIIIVNETSKFFSLNGIRFAKIYQPLQQGDQSVGIYNFFDTRQQLLNSTHYSDFEIDGETFASQALVMIALLDAVYSARLSDDYEDRIEALEANQVTGFIAFKTRFEFPPVGNATTAYIVLDDVGTPANNGTWGWDGAPDYYQSATTTADTALVNAATAQAAADAAQADADTAQGGVDANALHITTIVGDEADITDNYPDIATYLNANEESAKKNTDLIDANEGLQHARRVEADGGTTLDSISIDSFIRKFRSWGYAMKANSMKALKLFGSFPHSSDSDADFTRNAVCDTIDKNGVSVAVLADEPRLDFLGKHVEETDESFYSFDGVNSNRVPFDVMEFADGVAWSVSVLLDLDAIQEASFSPIGNESVQGTFYFNQSGNHFRFRSNGNQFSSEGVFDTTAGVLGQGKKLVTFVNDNVNILVYVDDALVDTLILPTDTSINFNTLGTGNGAGSNTKGKIFNHWIDNRALISQDVEDRFNGLPIPEEYKGANGVDSTLNGDFNSATGWGLGGSFNISAGKLNGSGTGVTHYATQDIGVVIGEKFIFTYEVLLNTLDGTGASLSSSGVFGSEPISQVLGFHTVIVEAVNSGSTDDIKIGISSSATSGVLELGSVSFIRQGNTFNLSKGKGSYGEDVVINGDFDTDTDWTKETGWSIAGGTAICSGSQVSDTFLIQSGIIEVGKLYKITFNLKSISAGFVEARAGISGLGEHRSAVGIYTDFIIGAGNTSFSFQGDTDFVGTIDNVTVKEASTWYDLDHGIKADVFASLVQSNGFGNIRIPIESEPALLLEGGTVTQNFLNSRTPVDQIVSGLVIGVDYTVNIGGSGIIEIQEVGVESGGFATETNHFTFPAKATSIDLTLIGAAIEWVNVTDTKVPYNHIESLGSTVSKVVDSLTLTSLQSKGFLSKGKGAWFVEFGDCDISGANSGLRLVTLGSDSDYLGFYTRANENNINIRIYRSNVLLATFATSISISNAKVLMFWDSDDLFASINGVDYFIGGDLYFSAYDEFVHNALGASKLKIKEVAFKDAPPSKAERIKLTTI